MCTALSRQGELLQTDMLLKKEKKKRKEKLFLVGHGVSCWTSFKDLDRGVGLHCVIMRDCQRFFPLCKRKKKYVKLGMKTMQI